MLFHLIMLKFFTPRWCHPCTFRIIKRIPCFSRFELCFWTKPGYNFSFLACKTSRAIDWLFFQNFSNPFFDGWVYFLLFFAGLFLVSSWLNATLIAHSKHLLTFLLMGFIVAFLFFIHSGESMYHPPSLKFILWNFWYNKLARSISRKSQNPRKFSFSSQTKYCPPIITFVHGVNLYL